MTKPAVVILAAGKGTRFKSRRPKALHPLAGRPMLLHLLAGVAEIEPERTVVVIPPDAPELSGALAAAPQAVETVVQEKALGTAHAVLAAKQVLEGHDGDILILYADAPLVRPETMEALIAARAESPHPAIVALGARLDDGRGYGRLLLDNNGALEAIVEYLDARPEERDEALCNAGAMAADAKLLFELLVEVGSDNAKGEHYLTDAVRLARSRGLTCAVIEGAAEEAMGINSRAELARAEAIVQRGLREKAMAQGATMADPATVLLSFDTALGCDVTIGPGVVFGPGVRVEDDAEIRAFCHLEGAHVSAGAVIGPFARLRPGAEIGEGARIGNFVEVKQARIGAGAKINHLTYIGDARVGEGANIGAGTITCNYDGVAKAHSEIGAGAFIGSNTALVAPVTIGDGAIVGAGSVIVNDVEAGALAVARGEQRNISGGAHRFRARKGSQSPARRKPSGKQSS